MDDWRDAFLAMSIALGDTLENASAAVPTAPEPLLATTLLTLDKRGRAQALAQTLAKVVLAIESLEAEVAP